MAISGLHRIILNRFMKRVDGKVQNYPLRMWVEVIDYACVRGTEFIATEHNVVFKRPYNPDNLTEGWVHCPELCVAFRGNGPIQVFKSPESLIEEGKENAAV